MSDNDGAAIRKITPSGVVTTQFVSGSSGFVNATGTAASFNSPTSVAVDNNGNVYVADTFNSAIRKITPGAVVTTLAGNGNGALINGSGATASFNTPHGVAVDAAGYVYVADTVNSVIRKITPDGMVSTLAGGGTGYATNGLGTVASFSYPQGIALDGAGNVYVADSYNGLIRKITPAGLVSTLAGNLGAAGFVDGNGAAASFNNPTGVAVDGAGNVYVADTNNNAIRKITPTGLVSTLAGSKSKTGLYDGLGTSAGFFKPEGITVDSLGNVYVADTTNSAIRKITPNGTVSTLVGTLVTGGSANAGDYGFVNGTASKAMFYWPTGIAVDKTGCNVYVADTMNYQIRKISMCH